MTFATRFLAFLVLCGALHAQEMHPDLAKLVSTTLVPAGVQFARTNGIATEGMDSAVDGDHLHPGDSITALITLFERGGHRTQWLLQLTTLESAGRNAGASKPPLVVYVGQGERVEFTQAMASVSLRLVGPFVADSAKSGRAKLQDQTARISVNEGFLGLGLEQAAASTHRIIQHHLHGSFAFRDRPFTESEIAEAKVTMANLHVTMSEERAIAGSTLALQSYTALVQETPGLDNLFFKVVKPPSIWSLVWHAGVKVSLELQAKDVAPTSTAIWHLGPDTPCYIYPLALRVNNKPALMTTLIVAPPRPPLLGCAGIVGLLAENPVDQETYLLLRIISAQHRKSG